MNSGYGKIIFVDAYFVYEQTLSQLRKFIIARFVGGPDGPVATNGKENRSVLHNPFHSLFIVSSGMSVVKFVKVKDNVTLPKSPDYRNVS